MTLFPDVPDGSTHAGSIRWAADQGLIEGYEDGTFRPGEPVTRGQLATVLHRQHLNLAGDPPPPPPPPDSGDRFLYSTGEITEFQSRMTGAGPFYYEGQGFYGSQTNAPGDGERAYNHANDFIADPLASRWTFPAPLEVADPWPGGSGSGISNNQALRPMRAAWCYMTLPGHANSADWRDEAKAWLLWNAREPEHNYADDSLWDIYYPGYQPSPIFALAGWMKRQIKTYDMLGRSVFTQSELDELDAYFYRWANFILHHIDAKTTKDRMEPDSDYAVGNYRDEVAYDGGANISEYGVFTNRSMACIGSGSIIAHYLHYHGAVPSRSGTQPSYGWWTVTEMRSFTRSVAEAWVKYSLHPDGWTYDYHRAQQDGKPTQGWAYAGNEIGHALYEAKRWARNGDDSLWQYTTTEGRNNTDGAPTPSEFTKKSLRYAQWMHARYVNDGWGRVVTTSGGTGPLADPDKAMRDVLNSAIVSARFPNDSLLMSSWTRDGNGFPGYPSNPETQGSWDVRDGEHAAYIGLIEVGGV